MIKILKKTITSADGYLLPYNEYKPKDSKLLSIILIYEIFGLTSHINDIALEYARKGFIVYVPDIFSRLESNVNLPYNKEGFNKGIKLKNKLGWDLPVMDIVALSASIKQNHNVSILGYCFGGSLAWLAMQKSFMFDKGVCYYGSSISDFLNSTLNCPVTLHFGKVDKGIPPSSIEKIKKYKNKEKEKIYLWEYDDADHGFNCNERKSYNKDAAELAFDRTLNFLTSS
jgi:carboxymethylenebutenolidase